MLLLLPALWLGLLALLLGRPTPLLSALLRCLRGNALLLAALLVFVIDHQSAERLWQDARSYRARRQ